MELWRSFEVSVREGLRELRYLSSEGRGMRYDRRVELIAWLLEEIKTSGQMEVGLERSTGWTDRRAAYEQGKLFAYREVMRVLTKQNEGVR